MITKQPLENLCSETNKIIKSSETIENQCLKIIQLFKPFYSTIEKPVEKIWEIKKVFMNCIERNGISGNSDDYMKYYVMIDNEFNKDGAFPTDLLFLKTFLATASSNMILIACKLFFVGSVDYKTGENISFNYLRQYIVDNAKDKDIVQIKLKNVKKSLKTIKQELLPLDELRNTYIAHYQMNKAPESIKIDINSLKKIYDVACELLEELSLMYFQGKDIGGYNFIRYQGFKKAICQNLIMDNIQKLDIETYFDYLRCRQTL